MSTGGWKVWSWMHSGSCWIQLDEGSRDELIIQLRKRREAAARIMASARFVLTEPGESPDHAFAEDPSADMPPPLQAEPPGAPGPWEHGYRLSDGEVAELRAENAALRGQLDHYLGRNVVHCMARNVGMASAALVDEGEGTILRTTDTSEEYELKGGVWLRTR